MSELLGFPGAAFDDQVDATTQLLLWVQEKDMYRRPLNEGPIPMDEEASGEPDVPWPYYPEGNDPWGAY